MSQEQRAFSRPAEFDESALRRAMEREEAQRLSGRVALTRRDQLKNEFGLSDGEDGDDASSQSASDGERDGDGAGRGRPEGRGRGRGGGGEAGADAAELRGLRRRAKEMRAALDGERRRRAKAEAEAVDAAAHVKQLQQTFKSTKAMLEKKYSGEIAGLRLRVEEQNDEIVEYEQIQEALSERLAVVERGGGGESSGEASAASAEGGVSDLVKRLRSSERERQRLVKELRSEGEAHKATQALLSASKLRLEEANAENAQLALEAEEATAAAAAATAAAEEAAENAAATAAASPAAAAGTAEADVPPPVTEAEAEDVLSGLVSDTDSDDEEVPAGVDAQQQAEAKQAASAAELAEARQALDQARQEAASTKQTLDEARQEVATLRAAVAKAEQEAAASASAASAATAAASTAAATATATAATVAAAADNSDRLEKLEAERKLFKVEMKKRQQERKAMVEKLTEFAAQLAAKTAEADGARAEHERRLGEAVDALTAATSQNRALLARVQEAEGAAGETAELRGMLRDMDALARKREQEAAEVREKAARKLKAAGAQLKRLQGEWNKQIARNRELREASAGLVALRGQCEGLREALAQVAAEARAVPLQAAAALEVPLREAAARMAEEQRRASEGVLRKLRREVAERRRLFNVVQELKGNVRVYCRVRPDREASAAVDAFPDEGRMTVRNAAKGQCHSFAFEHVFGPGSTQEQVFAEVGGLVTSALDGYNVCVLAYGQTGSGKTHTMEGPPSDRGVNFRALDRLFAVARDRAEVADYRFAVSVLEIYNEKINDLLGGGGGKDLKVVRGPDGMDVQGLGVVPVSSREEVAALMARAASARSVGCTDMNERSSRSHLVVTVRVEAVSTGPRAARTASRLHLVDLAGSERVSRSGAAGQRLVEAQNINKSLSTLGLCIASRVNKSSHVPYRNSALTYLLQDALGGNSKTLMFVNVSPRQADAAETVCSLKFAEHARKVELGKAKKNSKR